MDFRDKSCVRYSRNWLRVAESGAEPSRLLPEGCKVGGA
jgi:hypothetical protein